MTKVRIIGGKSKREHFVDDGSEVWGLNAIRPAWVPTWHRIFNLHTHQRLLDYRWNMFEKECDWSQEHPGVPFYTLDLWPDGMLTNNQIFPVQELTRMPRGRYHCGSFDWMVAFAIHLQTVDEIVLHGIGLCLEAGEPISARACLEYWCGVAEGSGIKVSCARDTDIFHFYHLVKSDLIYSVHDTPIYEDRTKEARKGAPYHFGD